MTAIRRRPGFTLIELVITIALLGLIASTATLAARRISQPPADDPARVLADSLRVVLATGRAATVQLVVRGERVMATIYADGSVVADTLARVDRLTGVVR